MLSDLLDKSGYEAALRTAGSQERLDNLAELKQSVYDFETTCGEETTLEQYLAHVALLTGADQESARDRVRLMTVHSAKGLEFPYVFLCQLSEGVFPSGRTRTIEGMEEERRLAFVALTRAKRGLYLSQASGRNFRGSPVYPSRFLLDIDPALLAWDKPPEEGLVEAARTYIDNSLIWMPSEEDPALPVGQRVRHPVFGAGTVLAADREKQAHAVRFDGMDTPRSISFRVKLERIEEEEGP